jgi:hypothetical protein
VSSGKDSILDFAVVCGAVCCDVGRPTLEQYKPGI